MRLKKYEFDNEYNCPFTAEQVLNGGLDVKRAYFEYRANVLRSLYAVSSKDLNYIRPLYTFINELKALCKNGFEMQLFNDIEERLVVYVEHLKDEGVIEEPNILAKQILNNPKKYLDERNKFYKDLISSGKIEKRMAKHIMLAYSGDCSLI